jgi:hypothetical protein
MVEIHYAVTTSSTDKPNESLRKTVVHRITHPSTTKIQKAKKPEIKFPLEKVHFTATVKQFALSWNHFSEENDEVVVLENVRILQEELITIDFAWCSHSKTLKKLELQSGERLEFDGKIVKKKLPTGKDVEKEYILDVQVPFKINNPSKIIKKQGRNSDDKDTEKIQPFNLGS